MGGLFGKPAGLTSRAAKGKAFPLFGDKPLEWIPANLSTRILSEAFPHASAARKKEHPFTCEADVICHGFPSHWKKGEPINPQARTHTPKRTGMPDADLHTNLGADSGWVSHKGVLFLSVPRKTHPKTVKLSRTSPCPPPAGCCARHCRQEGILREAPQESVAHGTSWKPHYHDLRNLVLGTPGLVSMIAREMGPTTSHKNIPACRHVCDFGQKNLSR